MSDYASDRIRGRYVGTHIDRIDGQVYLCIEVERDGKVHPEVLVFSESSFEDFRYVISDRSQGDGNRRLSSWERRQRSA